MQLNTPFDTAIHIRGVGIGKPSKDLGLPYFDSQEVLTLYSTPYLNRSFSRLDLNTYWCGFYKVKFKFPQFSTALALEDLWVLIQCRAVIIGKTSLIVVLTRI